MDADAKTALGHRLKKAIDRTNGMSAEKLAKKIKKTKPAVYKWINGESVPGLDSALDVCRELKIRLDWLATGHGDMDAAQTLSEFEIELLSVFRDMPHTAQENAAKMLKIGRTLYFGGDEERRRLFQESVTVHDEKSAYKTQADEIEQ